MKLKKRILSIIITIAICIVMIPLQNVATLAEEKSGICGDNLTWELTDDGILTVNGTGEMNINDGYTPWHDYKKYIKAVNISPGITSIARHAFYNCINLTSVYLPSSIISIREYSFENCEKLDSISIPEGVTSIGYQAFYNCGNLKNIELPDSISSIGISAFDGTPFYDNNVNFEDGALYLGNYLINAENVAENYEIREGTLVIAGRAFGSNKNLTSVFIPDSVIGISNHAFYDCSNLKSISIPDSITIIGESAFCECNKLESISIPRNVTQIYSSTFENCSSLVNVSIPDKITSIGNFAFENCINLADISIPESVTNIGVYAFCNCSNLNSVFIPGSVTNIYGSAFYGCSNLSSVSIYNGVTSIGSEAFCNCTNLKYINLPDSIINIGYSAFCNCTNLETINLPDNIKNIAASTFDGTYFYNNGDNWENDVLYIGNYLICARNIIGDYKVKDGTTVIAANAFSGNKNLISIFIPDSIHTVNDFAFSSCDKLEKVIIPRHLQIDEGVFTDCTGIVKVEVRGEDYNSDLDFNVYPASLRDINYEWPVLDKDMDYKRPVLNYNISGNTDNLVHYAESQINNLDFIKHNTYSDITSYYVFTETDKLQEKEDPDGNIFAFYGSRDKVNIIPKDTNKPLIQINNEGFNFGAATIGDDGYYYVIWGKHIMDEVIESLMNEENIKICKYDSSGKLVKELGFPVSYTRAQFPFVAGNADISYNKGYLCIMLDTEWTVSSDGRHHQGSEFIGVDAATMNLERFDNSVLSHSLGVSIIPTVDGFATIQRGDGTRGIVMNTYYLSDGITKLEKAKRALIYHASGQYGTNDKHLDGNETYTYMGGLAKSSSTYAVAGKSERIYTSDIFYNSGLSTGVYDVFVRIVDESMFTDTKFDFAGTTRINEATGENADYNVIWLTQCNDNEKAANVKIVTLPGGAYCVLWEKIVNNKFDSIRYVIMDECGNALRKETAIYGARLSDTSIQPIVQGNTLTWAVANAERETVTWYSVDLDLLEVYNSNKIIVPEIDDSDITVDVTPTPVPSIIPATTPVAAPPVTPIPSLAPENNIVYDNTEIPSYTTPVPSIIPEETESSSENVTNNEDNSNQGLENKQNPSAKPGKKTDINGLTYIITSTKVEKMVQFTGVKKDIKNIVIPSYIKIDGKKYKVTSIANKALNGNQKLKKLTIGTNIESIGKNAFKDCKNLKNIVIKSKKLTIKKTGKNAFKRINSKAVIKVPKSKFKLYKKIIRAKGAGNNIKIIK